VYVVLVGPYLRVALSKSTLDAEKAHIVQFISFT
jgi:hypothetical protein